MLQLVNKNGELIEAANINALFEPYRSKQIASISIFGAQSSGKSTLLNDLFGLSFPTLASDGARKRTTNGIHLALAIHEGRTLAIYDCEGTDSSERILNDETNIEQKIGIFSCAISDVMLINMWQSDLGRFQASNYHVVQQIFESYFSQLKAQRGELEERIRLVFVIRDAAISHEQQRTDIINQLQTDMRRLFDAFSQEKLIENFFDVQVTFMAHRKYEFPKYSQNLLALRESLLQVTANVKLAGELLPVMLERYWRIINKQEFLNLQQQRNLIVRQRLEIVGQDMEREFDVLLQKVQDQFENLFETLTRIETSSFASVSTNLKQMQQRFLLSKVTSYMQQKKPFDNISEHLSLMQQRFVDKRAELGVRSKEQLQESFQYRVQHLLNDFGMFCLGFFGRTIQQSFDQFHSDFAEHFKQYIEAGMPLKCPLDIFFPISPCQVYLQQVIHQVNALLGLCDGPLIVHLKKIEEVLEPTPSQQEDEMAEEAVQLAVLRQTLSGMNALGPVMRVQSQVLNSMSLSESYAVVSEGLLTGLYWLCNKVIGIDVLSADFQCRSQRDKLAVSVLYEFIQHANVESEFFFASVLERVQRYFSAQLRQQTQEFLQQQFRFHSDDCMEALSKHRDDVVGSVTKSCIEFTHSYLAMQFIEMDLNQHVLFSCRYGGQSFGEFMKSYERFNASVAIRAPFSARGQQSFASSNFAYFTAQQADIQTLALLDQEYQKTVAAFVEHVEVEQLVQAQLELYKQRMAGILLEQGQKQFVSERLRQKHSADVEQTISKAAGSFGGPLVSQIGLESANLAPLHSRVEIAARFHELVLQEGIKFPVRTASVSWGQVLLFAVLARRDIVAIFKNKVLLVVMIMIIGLVAFAH